MKTAIQKAFEKTNLKLVKNEIVKKADVTIPKESQYIKGSDYSYRDLAPEDYSDEELWSVVGKDSVTGEVGVLEWCSSEYDAKERLAIMKQYPQFTGLEIEPLIERDENGNIPVFKAPPVTVKETKVSKSSQVKGTAKKKPVRILPKRATYKERSAFFFAYKESVKKSLIKAISMDVILTIASSGLSQKEVAERMGIHRVTIGKLIRQADADPMSMSLDFWLKLHNACIKEISALELLITEMESFSKILSEC